LALAPLLLDMNLPASLGARLAAQGIQAAHCRERGLARATDEEIVAHARSRAEIVVTNDVDFGRILRWKERRHPAS
jgi:predicted nuclease of predicted toxin-antitoxin system